MGERKTILGLGSTILIEAFSDQKLVKGQGDRREPQKEKTAALCAAALIVPQAVVAIAPSAHRGWGTFDTTKVFYFKAS